MKWLHRLLNENTDEFAYMMNEKSMQNYQERKLKFAALALIPLLFVIFDQAWNVLWTIPCAVVLFYKMPYLLLVLKHNQNCIAVVCAVPLWVNQLYALIEKNTIHNAIVNSYSKHTPAILKHDLEAFIAAIEKEPNSREAYMQFLSRYRIDGMSDIMLKLYEYRGLSKEKLKYEIHNLNQSLGKIETLKRQSQFKREVFIGDTCTCFIIFVPCLYMTVISLMPTLFTV